MGPAYLSMVLLLSSSTYLTLLPQETSGYNITCLAFDFDCGQLADTMSLLCKVYRSHIDERRRRSVNQSQPSPLRNFQGIRTLPFKMYEELTQETTNTSLNIRGGRFRRNTRRNTTNVYNECCQQPNCTYNDLREYCEILQDGIYTC
uniref:Insulin-like androgenic gland hormone 2 n=1 Tax=Lysmata vittata TaxID=749979 RepID=A0A7L7YYA2_9EUCA|nr:insulin-like androgenic gland hormone 2 [Lysmata vittata]